MPWRETEIVEGNIDVLVFEIWCQLVKTFNEGWKTKNNVIIGDQ
jgi:hypothetical protein